MTHAEAVSWSAYIAKRGTLNLGMRMEIGFATLAALIVNRTGGKAKLSDFMTVPAEVDGEGDATLEDVMGILMKAKR